MAPSSGSITSSSSTSQNKSTLVFFATFMTWLLFSVIQTATFLSKNTSDCSPTYVPPHKTDRMIFDFTSSSSTTTSGSHTQQQQQQKFKNSPLRYPPGRQYAIPSIQPTLGTHRPNVDAFFSMATGYDIDDHLITVSSLLDTNFTGDIVLGVQPLKNCSEQLLAYLTYHSIHSNVVVYAIPPCERMDPDVFKHLRCSLKYAYKNPYYENRPVSKTTNRLTGNDLAARHQSPRKFRYEHYWIWQRNYNPESRIFLTDFRDLVFQNNPMDHWSLRTTTSTTLHLFEESNLRRITEVDRFTGGMIRDFFGPGMVDRIGNETVICSGVTMGGKIAIEQYLLKMIWHMDNIQGNRISKGDQAHHNVLYYTGELSDQMGIDEIKVWPNFVGAVATTGYTYRASGIDTGDVTDVNGNIIPIVHQFDRSRNLNRFIQKKRDTHWQIQAEQLLNRSLTTVREKGKRKPS